MVRVSLILTLSWFLLSPSFLFAQGVDILWQAETYTPPFYKGASLWSQQSRIKFVAIPYGFSNPTSLNYKWIRNGTVLGNTSGVGKNVIFYTDSIVSKPQTIEVEIISGGNNTIARSSVTVGPTLPQLSIYESNPLYGFMFHKEVGDKYKLINKEATFAVFPLFFSALERRESNLVYEWRSNAGTAETSNLVTYRSPDGAAGLSEIRVKVSNSNELLQTANRNFLIEFGN